MPHYASPATPARTGEVADTLRLLAYLVLALVLIVLDHRGGWLNRARQQADVLVQPLWMAAGWPGRMAEKLYDDAGTLSQLTAENERLRNEMLVSNARLARLRTVAADNARLRGLLGAAERGGLDVQLAPVLDIDLDLTRQRLVLDAGSADGVRVGQSVIDAGGLLGQVIDTTPMHASVLLLTDASHAVPVAVARNGVRLVAYGTGSSERLRLASIPLSSDVKVGDLLVTSGLGARFPAGFQVGTVAALRPDDSRAFLLGDVRPAAQLGQLAGRGVEVDVVLDRLSGHPGRLSGRLGGQSGRVPVPSLYGDLDRPPLHGLALQRALRPDGWRLQVLAETASTNALLTERARAGEPAGLVVVAESQTDGRGRLDRSWVSPPRAGLTFSVLLRPNLPVARWGWVPLWGGLAVAEALRERCEVEAVVKWPNDVLVGGEKVCGLLAEATGTVADPAVRHRGTFGGALAHADPAGDLAAVGRDP
ncbi:MAG: rod shape-determining protein MreC, partial [Proteobacteria bacterium]|nr:rod shape-determining protein MreC [Pseudomonadota bacterium]